MLRIRIDPRLTEMFPDICVSAIRVMGLVATAGRIAAAPLLADAAAAVAAEYGGDGERLTSDPRIATWREAYRRVNVKPNKYRSSVEALARRALKGQSIDTGLTLVDLYNAVSLRHRAPLGAVDVDRMPGQIMTLRFSTTDDRFEPIGNHPDGFPIVPPVAVYAVGEEILCWGFNCRDSRKTALDNSTRAAVFVAESIDLGQRNAATDALLDLGRQLGAAGAITSALATATAGLDLSI